MGLDARSYSTPPDARLAQGDLEATRRKLAHAEQCYRCDDIPGDPYLKDVGLCSSHAFLLEEKVRRLTECFALHRERQDAETSEARGMVRRLWQVVFGATT